MTDQEIINQQAQEIEILKEQLASMKIGNDIFMQRHVMSAQFTKYYLRHVPFFAVLHHFTDRDHGLPHDHPFGFRSFILKGGYVEKSYHLNEDGSYMTDTIKRFPGESFYVPADHIHEIVELLDGDCWTIILPEPECRKWRVWNFAQNPVKYKIFDEPDFKVFGG